jgi:putative NADH-flavin reductase
MKIALYGATGNIGQRILKEALRRGHEVTAIVRDQNKVGAKNSKLKYVIGDILNPADVCIKSAKHDVVISAYGPGHSNPKKLVEATQSLIEGVRESGVKRLIVVGGAGSLEVSPGIQLVDTPQFPEAWKGIANAHRDALELYKKENSLDWSYASPAAFIEPGEITGKFRWGGNQLLIDEVGNSKISMEDYAIALLDEAENPNYVHKQFSVAY